MTAVTAVALIGLSLAGLLCIVRLLRPGSIANRIVALDSLLIVVACGIGVLTVRTGTTAFVPVLLVVSLTAFVGTITVARFIERRGAGAR
jgi:multicomponent Na+:H+ antiporter subunit F